MATLDHALYTAGSLVFFAASILFHPTFTATPGLYVLAVCGFIAGSLLFTTAGGLGLVAVVRQRHQDPAATGTASPYTCWALSCCLRARRLSCQGLVPTEPWWALILFAVVLSHTFLSSVWSLAGLLGPAMAARRISAEERRQGAALLAYLGGALLFVAGGVCFLRLLPAFGSALWTVGSGLFFLGSATYLRAERAA